MKLLTWRACAQATWPLLRELRPHLHELVQSLPCDCYIRGSAHHVDAHPIVDMSVLSTDRRVPPDADQAHGNMHSTRPAH